MFIESPPITTRHRRVSVFVDGDNLAARCADVIRGIAARAGVIEFFRVYGGRNAAMNWQAVPDARFVLAGEGKNAADLLLTVEAMDRALRQGVETVVLASSDGDFSHLATYLRETRHQVIGVGDGRTPEGFRRSCSVFEEIQTVRPTAPCLSALDRLIYAEISAPGNPETGMRISILGARMNSCHKFCKDKIEEENWRAYFHKRPLLYELDPKGPDARVRIRTRSDVTAR